MIGAALLDGGIYEDIEADPSATVQSAVVVVLASLATGFGATGMFDTPATLRAIAIAAAAAMATWLCWGALTLQVGSHVLPTSRTDVTLGQLLRTLGFSSTPALIQVFGVLPAMQRPLAVVAAVWTLVASIVAVRHALDYTSIGRAIAVCVLAWTLAVAVLVIVGLLGGSAVS